MLRYQELNKARYILDKDEEQVETKSFDDPREFKEPFSQIDNTGYISEWQIDF